MSGLGAKALSSGAQAKHSNPIYGAFVDQDMNHFRTNLAHTPLIKRKPLNPNVVVGINDDKALVAEKYQDKRR